MGDAQYDKRLLKRLVALMRAGRTFSHQGNPLLWVDVRRVGNKGRAVIAELYGKDSPEVAAFNQYWEEAFIPPMSLRQPGRVDKPASDVFEIALENVPGVPLGENIHQPETRTEDRVRHLNSIDLRHALQILVEAAQSVRTRLRQSEVTPPAAPPEQLQKPDKDERTQVGSRPRESGTNSTGTDRRAAVDAFIAAVNVFIERCESEMPLRVERQHIWKAVGHRSPRQFQHWQALDPETTAQDEINFPRILKMSPADFVAHLKKTRIFRAEG